MTKQKKIAVLLATMGAAAIAANWGPYDLVQWANANNWNPSWDMDHGTSDHNLANAFFQWLSSFPANYKLRKDDLIQLTYQGGVVAEFVITARGMTCFVPSITGCDRYKWSTTIGPLDFKRVVSPGTSFYPPTFPISNLSDMPPAIAVGSLPNGPAGGVGSGYYVSPTGLDGQYVSTGGYVTTWTQYPDGSMLCEATWTSTGGYWNYTGGSSGGPIRRMIP